MRVQIHINWVADTFLHAFTFRFVHSVIDLLVNLPIRAFNYRLKQSIPLSLTHSLPDLKRALNSEVFPLPVLPMMPIFSPGSVWSDTPFNAGRSVPRYVITTSSNVIVPWNGQSSWTRTKVKSKIGMILLIGRAKALLIWLEVPLPCSFAFMMFQRVAGPRPGKRTKFGEKFRHSIH